MTNSQKALGVAVDSKIYDILQRASTTTFQTKKRTLENAIVAYAIVLDNSPSVLISYAEIQQAYLDILTPVNQPELFSNE